MTIEMKVLKILKTAGVSSNACLGCININHVDIHVKRALVKALISPEITHEEILDHIMSRDEFEGSPTAIEIYNRNGEWQDWSLKCVDGESIIQWAKNKTHQIDLF